jgi:hypothetical protein
MTKQSSFSAVETVAFCLQLPLRRDRWPPRLDCIVEGQTADRGGMFNDGSLRRYGRVAVVGARDRGATMMAEQARP